ncbi:MULTISPECIES: hypothetical protein [Mycolicibacterium]|uniref:hypothetical protein n=1 Tax=Mycolicibacterium TaxID=1866885 RepID=UPI0011632062|nr:MULTISPECIES: hypothetical protein [Mycolicibacterium]MCC9181168.1 hypothetical protein [Mycolicibacterium mageritense]QDF19342.1 hypothetical protein SEA_CRACKLEWINK_56 [Mycobacterium phage Cracklewink]UBV14869.1 hypothetical protein H8Z57_29965 [Mycolicibacterium fortuitum]
MIVAALGLAAALLVIGMKAQEPVVIAMGGVLVLVAIYWAVRDEIACRGETFGACGVRGCRRCRPLFDRDNRHIPGSDR